MCSARSSVSSRTRGDQKQSAIAAFPCDPVSLVRSEDILFKITCDDIYCLLLDNGQAWLLPRKVTLHVDAILPHSTPESEQMQANFNEMYSQLKLVLVFADFRISVRHCGVVNAFSNPNITLCVELLEQLESSNAASGFRLRLLP